MRCGLMKRENVREKGIRCSLNPKPTTLTQKLKPKHDPNLNPSLNPIPNPNPLLRHMLELSNCSETASI